MLGLAPFCFLRNDCVWRQKNSNTKHLRLSTIAQQVPKIHIPPLQQLDYTQTNFHFPPSQRELQKLYYNQTNTEIILRLGQNTPTLRCQIVDLTPKVFTRSKKEILLKNLIMIKLLDNSPYKPSSMQKQFLINKNDILNSCRLENEQEVATHEVLKKIHNQQTEVEFIINIKNREDKLTLQGRIVALYTEDDHLYVRIQAKNGDVLVVLASEILCIDPLVTTIPSTPDALENLFVTQQDAIFSITRKKTYGSKMQDSDNPQLQAWINTIRAQPPKIIFTNLPLKGRIVDLQTNHDGTIRATIQTPSNHKLEFNQSEIQSIDL